MHIETGNENHLFTSLEENNAHPRDKSRYLKKNNKALELCVACLLLLTQWSWREFKVNPFYFVPSLQLQLHSQPVSGD